MAKLFICAGHSHIEPGTQGNGLMENLLTIELRDLITAECKALGAQVWNDKDDQTLKQVINQLNKLSTPADTVLDIHFNAGPSTTTGVEAFIAMKASVDERQLAQSLCAVVCQTLGSVNRNVKPENLSQHKTLGILHTPGRNVLLEVCFITNKAEVTRYLANKKLIAKRIAQVLVPLPI